MCHASLARQKMGSIKIILLKNYKGPWPIILCNNLKVNLHTEKSCKKCSNECKINPKLYSIEVLNECIFLILSKSIRERFGRIK